MEVLTFKNRLFIYSFIRSMTSTLTIIILMTIMYFDANGQYDTYIDTVVYTNHQEINGEIPAEVSYQRVYYIHKSDMNAIEEAKSLTPKYKYHFAKDSILGLYTSKRFTLLPCGKSLRTNYDRYYVEIKNRKYHFVHRLLEFHLKRSSLNADSIFSQIKVYSNCENSNQALEVSKVLLTANNFGEDLYDKIELLPSDVTDNNINKERYNHAIRIATYITIWIYTKDEFIGSIKFYVGITDNSNKVFKFE